MKKILILGGNGFTGRNLKEYLLSTGKYIVLAPARQELDLLNEREVAEYLSSHLIDVVFHCAIFVPRTLQEEQEILEKDLRIFLNLEKHSDKYKKMFYMGSGAEYDKSQDISVVREEETGRRIPENQYGFAKYIIGKMIENSSNIYNFRIWGLFGKYEDWWTTFISGCCCKAIKGYPLSIRQDVYFDYLWVNDFCKIAEWAIAHEFKYHTYNAGSGNRILLSEIAKYVKKISGKEIDIIICRPGLGKEYTADSMRLREEYGKDYHTPIEDAIRNLYQWYEKNEDIIDIQKLIYQS